MSSPIHSFLFSPPPSPPSRAVDKDPNHGLTSIKSLLHPTEFIPRSSLDGSTLKVRSPRTPQQSRFTLNDNVYPSSYPSRAKEFDMDLEATPIAREPSTPRQRPSEKLVSSPPYVPSNVPSSPLPIPSSLPKPLLRLLFLASLLVSSILILVFVPAARIPSLRAAGASRRLAMSPDGTAYLDIESPIDSWTAARDRDYRPPQIKAVHMMKRATMQPKAAPAPHPKTTRPALTARPLPSTHELLALQSYVLSSAYNVLPAGIDPQQPLDANAILGIAAHKIGPAGGHAENAWLEELKAERDDDVVVWYGGNGRPTLPHDVLDMLQSTHGSSRLPTFVPCHARPDRSVLLSVLERLGLPLRDHPIIMIGNEPIVGDLQTLEELRLSGALEEKFAAIGWKSTATKKVDWKPKMAVVKKKEISEMEEALKVLQMELDDLDDE
ncbi:hypothetical protein CI109_107097 [Kwoniella shandongensis]|uniref:Uncharacterized protein n=1 Tax=Kwoniella shandongensis TaxID=1734106 RepID=A0A5M6C771_9TREE|nr:uncharacterized protein CI109_002380 [Kwoniella shandongensis]KAA5529039.1 hypothetical protein CI109_002380 [Kwoniella shandongensis]